LSQNDYHTLMIKNTPGRITPVAMSEHGQRVLGKAGIDAGYVPHALDMELWKPDPMRLSLRAAFGIPEHYFAIGMNYNNIDPIRKATPENFLAFKEFHDRVPNSILFAHTMAAMAHSLDQRVLARTLGITDYVRFADQERVHNVSDKQFTTKDMVRWYTAMDVVLNSTYGEGFGLPALEAQACGTPVILSDGTTGPQLKGPGWLVNTEPFWNVNHAAWWHRPSVHSIKKQLNSAYQSRSPFKRHAARLFAEKYDIRLTGPMWSEMLEQRTAGGAAAPGLVEEHA
jgi:glycosyltransferase involved in cell wall biosynthesis